MTNEAIVSIVNSIVALIISIIALIYTIKAYLLKRGSYIRGSFSICSTIACEDKYVSSVVLENHKDRAVVIYQMFLRIGHNYFIEIEDFGKEPLVLNPFEVYRKDYDPIDFYSVSLSKIELNNLLDNKRYPKKIILSTSNGKYIVKKRIEYWNPIGLFFKNHMTAIVHPMRTTYKGISYGNNARYIVEFKTKNAGEEIIAIYPNDYTIQKFRKFSLTKKSLESKEALEEYLYSQATEGNLNCDDIKVFELDKWREDIYDKENKRIIKADYCNWFYHHLIGRIWTIFSNMQMKKKNKVVKKKAAQKCKI